MFGGLYICEWYCIIIAFLIGCKFMLKYYSYGLKRGIVNFFKLDSLFWGEYFFREDIVGRLV